MLTTNEAAKILGVSRRRVLSLIESGQLSAQKTGNMWLLEEEAVAQLNKPGARKVGRPKNGSRVMESRFVLMNRTYPIADVVYDASSHEFTSVGSLRDTRRAPLGLASPQGSISPFSFNSWWRNRGIPEGRTNIQEILSSAGIPVATELSLRSLGLSLSDQYWLCPFESGIKWENVNFFNNTYPDTLHIEGSTEFSLHPDNTSDGMLAKHWVVRNGKRILLKGGNHNNQEPFNEVIATALHKRLLKHGEYVPYHLDQLEGKPASACTCFVGDNEEFIPAFYVAKSMAQPAHHNDYQHYVECCTALGIGSVQSSLARTIVCDDILANTDRHARNYGIIRNVETLECRMAPIFDSGTSLWCTTPYADLKLGNYAFKSRQFNSSPAKQLLLTEDLSWVDTSALEGFTEEAVTVLSKNESIQERIPYIEKALTARVARMTAICEAL